MQKESPRTRKFGGFCSHYFAGDFALRRYRNSTRRYSATPEREFESQFPLFPLNSKKLSPVCFSLPQFAPACPICIQSQKMPRIHGAKFGSRFFGSSAAISRITVGHGKLRLQLMITWDIACQRKRGREALQALAATMNPQSSTCTARSEAPSSQYPLPQKRSSAFRFSHKLSFQD